MSEGADAKERRRAIGARLAVALVHHPVLGAKGEIITSSVTTLDVHDFARVCRTYGVAALYIITPLKAQQAVVNRLIRHWREGYGGARNPHRKEALTDVFLVDSIDHMVNNFRSASEPVVFITTSARRERGVMGAQEVVKELERFCLHDSGRAILLFGTSHGLADEVMEKADYRLEPIEGMDNFNHLPVRAAAAITLDRLLGEGRGL